MYLHSVFVWTQPHHAPTIAGSVTAIFILIWLLNASILTTFSIIGILITVSDYAVPLVSSNFFDSSKWGATQEATYEKVCDELALFWFTVNSFWTQWTEIKETKPKLYSFILLTTLLMLAYIGNMINNLLLSYLICLFACMYPGLKSQGLLNKYLSEALTFIKTTIGEKLNKQKQK